LKSSAELSIICRDVHAATVLAKVLAPDNEGAPRGLRFSMERHIRTVFFDVESDSPSTSISTCLGILRDVGLFGEIWLLTEARKASTAGQKPR
jgi:hypothetical protein